MIGSRRGLEESHEARREALWCPAPRHVPLHCLHQLTELRLRALECYAAAGLGLGGTELAAAVRAGRQLTRLAPLRESGYRYLMQALTAQDNVAEALHVYGQLCDCLRDQLGVPPSAATRELYERLLAAT